MKIALVGIAAIAMLLFGSIGALACELVGGPEDSSLDNELTVQPVQPHDDEVYYIDDATYDGWDKKDTEAEVDDYLEGERDESVKGAENEHPDAFKEIELEDRHYEPRDGESNSGTADLIIGKEAEKTINDDDAFGSDAEPSVNDEPSVQPVQPTNDAIAR